MIPEPDSKETKSNFTALLILGWTILFFHLTIVCHSSLVALGLPTEFLGSFIRSLNHATSLFDSVWYVKLAALLLLGFYTLGSSAKEIINAEHYTGTELAMSAVFALILYTDYFNMLTTAVALHSPHVTRLGYAVMTLYGYGLLIMIANKLIQLMNSKWLNQL